MAGPTADRRGLFYGTRAGQEVVARQAANLPRVGVVDGHLLVAPLTGFGIHRIGVRLRTVALRAVQAELGEDVHGMPGRLGDAPHTFQRILMALAAASAVRLTVSRGGGPAAHLVEHVLVGA